MTNDTQEADVRLTQHDIDHLQDGQPVFKPGRGDTLLVLRKENDE